MTKFERTLVENRLEHASHRAQEVLDTFGYTSPVEPLTLAKNEGRLLRTQGGNLGAAFDGQLEFHPRKGCFLLLFNTKYDRSASEHHPRTRFSIAHELGHYFLEPHRSHLIRGGAPHPSRGEFVVDQIVEREADSFAAGLLLPDRVVKPFVNASPLTLARVEELASTMRVSLVCAAIRGVKLSHFPVAAAGLSVSGRAWFVASDAFYKAGCMRLSNAALPRGKALDALELFRCGLAKRSQADSSITNWFRLADSADLSHVQVTEEYVPLATMGTLLVFISADERDLFGD